MDQPKVKQTQKYSDSQGEHIVCEGKLVLVEKDSESNSLLTQSSIGHISKRKGDIIYDPKGLDPIIISETEEIEIGDKYLEDGKFINTCNSQKEADTINNGVIKGNKILALPEHFSDKHLQAIVDGKMKDGDEVLVKCHKRRKSSSIPLTGQGVPEYVYRIDLNNRQKHITLFLSKQSLEEASHNFINEVSAFKGKDAEVFNPLLVDCFEAGAEWAKKNNY